ncbi:MAG: hypothetical protein V4731_06440 [Pseudomonadota bacterium]
MEEVNLLTVAFSKSEGDQRFSPNVAIAAVVLKRFVRLEGDPILDIGLFADERVETVFENTEVANFATRNKSYEAMRFNVPGESYQDKVDRIGKAHASTINVRHRYVSALSVAIVETHLDGRPHGASNSELCAAAGLLLYLCSLSQEPDVKLGKQLDAMECFHRAVVECRPENRAEWKIEFEKFLPNLRRPNEKWASAKQAMSLFQKKFPSCDFPFLQLPLLKSFHKPYSEMKRTADKRAVKPREKAAFKGS